MRGRTGARGGPPGSHAAAAPGQRVAAWHEHVNICLPPKSGYATADWRRFGFKGTIATASECQAGGGIFHPVIFNWMVHVYPFAQDPAKVWAH